MNNPEDEEGGLYALLRDTNFDIEEDDEELKEQTLVQQEDTNPDMAVVYERAVALYKEDKVKASVETLFPIAEQGFPDAQFLLASISEKNLLDLETATKWYLKAAEAGNIGAKSWLIQKRIFAKANKPPLTPEKTVAWLEELSEAKFQSAFQLLYLFHSKGWETIPADPKKAEKCFQQICEQFPSPQELFTICGEFCDGRNYDLALPFILVAQERGLHKPLSNRMIAEIQKHLKSKKK